MEEKKEKGRVQEELLKQHRDHEEEVTLRLRFEDKINSLHALYRTTHTSLQQTSLRFQELKQYQEEV